MNVNYKKIWNDQYISEKRFENDADVTAEMKQKTMGSFIDIASKIIDILLLIMSIKITMHNAT